MIIRPDVSRKSSDDSLTPLLRNQLQVGGMPTSQKSKTKVNVWLDDMYNDLKKIPTLNPRAPFMPSMPTPAIALEKRLKEGAALASSASVSLEEILCKPQQNHDSSLIDLFIQKKVFECLHILPHALKHGVLCDGETEIGKSFVAKKKGDRFFGLSDVEFSNFEGELVEGKAHGWGRLYLGSLSVFEGTFQNGYRHGEGVEYRTLMPHSNFICFKSEEVWFEGKRISDSMTFFKIEKSPQPSPWQSFLRFFELDKISEKSEKDLKSQRDRQTKKE